MEQRPGSKHPSCVSDARQPGVRTLWPQATRSVQRKKSIVREIGRLDRIRTSSGLVCHPFENGELGLPSTLAERIELRRGIGKENARSFELCNTTLVQKNNLQWV